MLFCHLLNFTDFLTYGVKPSAYDITLTFRYFKPISFICAQKAQDEKMKTQEKRTVLANAEAQPSLERSKESVLMAFENFLEECEDWMGSCQQKGMHMDIPNDLEDKVAALAKQLDRTPNEVAVAVLSKGVNRYLKPTEKKLLGTEEDEDDVLDL